jgi:hypothetical protein
LISKKTKTRDEEEDEKSALGPLEHQTHLVLATQICNKLQKTSCTFDIVKLELWTTMSLLLLDHQWELLSAQEMSTFWLDFAVDTTVLKIKIQKNIQSAYVCKSILVHTMKIRTTVDGIARVW